MTANPIKNPAKRKVPVPQGATVELPHVSKTTMRQTQSSFTNNVLLKTMYRLLMFSIVAVFTSCESRPELLKVVLNNIEIGWFMSSKPSILISRNSPHWKAIKDASERVRIEYLSGGSPSESMKLHVTIHRRSVPDTIYLSEEFVPLNVSGDESEIRKLRIAISDAYLSLSPN